MTPILLISYFFPPVGMAGSARPLGLFRYLPENGYRPYVLTVKNIIYPAHDTTMLRATDEQFISRTESLDPSRILYRLGSRRAHQPNQSGIMSRWATPDFKVGWRRFAVKEACRLIEKHNIKLIVTTSPPPSIHQIGMELKKRCDVTWVADFRDVWVSRKIEDAYRSHRQRRRSQKLLADYRRTADSIVAVNTTIGEYVGAEDVVTNGADPDTYTHWDSAAESCGGVFRIGYLGTTDSERTLAPFVRALAEALRQLKKTANEARVVFVGKTDKLLVSKLFAREGMSEALELTGYLSRHEAIQYLAPVNTLLATSLSDKLSHVTPSKIFDYLVSGKPIIAIAPVDSELGKLALAENESVFEETDVGSLTLKLKSMIESKADTSPASHLTSEELKRRRERYGWPHMAKSFARVLDEIR